MNRDGLGRSNLGHLDTCSNLSRPGAAFTRRYRLPASSRLLPVLIASLCWLVGGVPLTFATAAPTIAVMKGSDTADGILEVRGAGFTTDSTVTVAIFDGDSTNHAARKSVRTVVATGGTFSLTFPIAELGSGPNGSQDPAWSLVPGAISSNRVVGATHGPNGSQDPAWSLATGMSTCDSHDLVAAYDPALNYWTPAMHIGC